MQKPSSKTREAREIFLRMESEKRLSRSVRIEWLLEHFGNVITLETNDICSNQPYHHHGRHVTRWKGISVYGLLPEKRTTKLEKDEQLRIGQSTSITFLSFAYRIAFVVDLSPSSFVIDDLDSVLYKRLISAVIKCLRSLVKEIFVPGASIVHCPTILVSLCAFSPFLCFPNDNVLLQGAFLHKNSLDSIINHLVVRVKYFVDALILFAKPHIKEWTTECKRSRLAKNSFGSGRQTNRIPLQREDMSTAPVPGNPLSSDKGFVHSEWSLIFMLRMGLFSVQLMRSLSLAHIVIVTDGVCSVFDQMALQGILAQLRLHSIACSFIQLRSPSLRGPVLGHVGFSDLLKFIAAATHGTFLFEDQLDSTEDPSDPLDSVQRALLTWSFRTRPNDFSDATKNHSSGEMRANYVRNKHFSRALDGSLANLLSARLCEGYSVRQIEQSVGSVDHHPETTASTSSTTALLWIRLSLAWRPFVTIEYNICVPKSKAIWPSVLVGHRSCTLRVEVFIEARLSCSTANLLGERHDPASLRTAISSLNESDTLLLHLNSFNMDPAYWEVPKEVDRSIALFEYKKASQSVGLTERYEALCHSKFVSYWQPLSSIDQYHWQRLMHTHSVRLILTHDLPLPERIFTSQSKGRFGQVTSEMAFNELHAHLRRWASFVLVRDQSYVCFLYDRNGAESPTKKNPTNVVPPEFFLVRITHDLPCAIVRLSFPGCISAQTRGDILCQFTNSLERLRTVRDVQMVGIGEQFEQRQDTAVKTTLDLPSLCIVQKPYERFLVRYRTIPYDLRLIVRLEHTDSLFAKREMILHNALANFLSCRRQVWHFRDVFLKNTVPSLSSLEFILQTLLRLRLNQGFKIAYSRNGIITLLRQMCAQKVGINGSVPVLEQCILFGPTLVENERGEKLPSEIPMDSFGKPRSLQNDNDLVDHQLFKSNEEIIEDQHFGTIESSRSGTMHQTNDSGKINMLKTQIITEVWSEPTGQTEHQKTGDDEKGMEQSRKELLQQNDLIIRTLFTFDQLMSVCNSRLWVEKPYVIKTAKENEESKCDNLPTDTSVRFMSDPFELDTLFRHATQRHLIMLPAMGYADGDPHSMTRQSFLLKSLQHELSEFCDVCIETSDEALISSIMAQLKQCQYDGQESDSFNEIDILQTPSCNLPAPGSPTASFSMRNDTEISPSVFSESTNDYGVATIYNQPNGQGSIQFPVSSFQRKKQLNHRSTSVPLLCDEHGQVKQLLSQTKRLTPMKGIDKETAETKPTHAQRLKSASSAIVVAASAQQRQEGQRQRLAQTPSGGFLLGTLTTGECELHPKKLSAPSPAVTAFSNIRQHKTETVPMNQCKNTKTTSVVRALRVYAKRLNNWRLLIYVMAKDARMCRQMMRTKSTFPVMTFLCDKPQMAKNFVESGTMAKWSLQNFKIETNPEKENANLLKEEHPSPHKDSVDLDIFFLSGSYAAANTVLLDTEYSEYVSLYLPLFNLREHNETVFHRQLFTKAFICSVYACLCHELFVPVSVLSNVLNFRCEPTTIEVGSINEILRNTCTHLATLTNARQETDAFPASDTVVASSSQMPFALCSSPISDDSSPSEQVVLHPTKDDHPLSLPHSMNRSSGEETLVMTETESERGLDQDCHNQLDDFRNAFDQLLQSHGFHRVPGLPDYFFYWPKPRAQEDYLLSSMNLPGLEDFVKIPMNGLALSSPPVFGTAPPLEVSRPEPKKASNFTRHSSARNTMNYRGTPAASILEGRRRHTNTMEPIVAKQQAQAVEDTRELRVKCDCSESTASWELDPMGCTVDGMGNSEKSSLAGELLGTESWPLFVQFSVSVQLHNGLSQNVPIGFIPNCFKQIMDRCDISFRQKLSPDQISISDYAGKSANLQLAGVNVLISMDLLTWPLKQHNQQQQQLSHHFSGENNSRILGETFGGSDGSELLSHLRQPQQSGDDEQLFERKVEMLRQIPAEERRLLRKLQRNVQKMMNTEHVLIMSRSFEDEEKVGTLLGIAGVIRDEVEVSAGSTNTCPTTEQTLARFDMTSKELVLVADQEDGLRRLGAKLNGLPVEYCRLRELPVPSPSDIEKNAANTEETFPFDMDAMLDGTLMLFYTCGVADLEKFARTRHDSIRQIGHSFKHLADTCEKTTIETEEQPDSLADGEVASILAGKAPIGHTVDRVEAEAEDYDEEVDEDEGEEQGDGFCNSSTTADDGTIAEITMPLNDSTEYGPFCQRISLIDVALANQMRQQPPRISEPSVDNLFGSRHNLLKRQQLLHDFWLIVQIEDGGGRRMGTESSLSVNIFFCQRAFLLHEQLFESACRLIDEQIRTVNQEALLERMHQTEECDQLLADHDFAPQLKSHGLRTTGSLDPASVGTATLRSAKNVPGETLARTVSAKPSPIQRPSSLLSEGETTPSVMTAAAVSTSGANHVRDNSLTYSDEDGDHSSELNALARRKFHPGYFACEMVWHHWFSIHPRLQPSRTFGGCNDIGFKALRLGLEVLAVRNRSNMYVYKERNGNVVYLRLHATEESILNNIPGGNFTGWEEEVRKHCHNCILLAVHGVRPPGEEITEQLMNVLQRRLNSRTLEEIQNALLKNAHIRLEWSDIKFIQREPNKPDAVFFFTVPQLAHHHLNAVKYYLSQQMLTFCISPKFREQSGAALLRSKYSGSASITGGQHYFSGGTTGTSRALSLAGTPTLEHHQQQQWTTKGSIDGRESVQHTFVPFTGPNVPSNPVGYTPTFYLVNKPPGEGKRDTGISCLEVRLVDWTGRLMEHIDESRMDLDSRILPGGGDSCDPIQRFARINELIKSVQVDSVGIDQVQPMPNTCALFQFNMWQNGNVGIEELEHRLRICVHQSICDLVTEFALLSAPLFDATLSPLRSKTGSFSVSNNTRQSSLQHPPPIHHQKHDSLSNLKPSSSALPLLQSGRNATSIGPPPSNVEGFVSPVFTTQSGSSAPIHRHNSPLKPFVQQQIMEGVGTDHHPSMTVPLMGRIPRQPQSPNLFTGAEQQQPQQQQQFQNVENQSEPGEQLRSDFVAMADLWFEHVINETKGSPEMSHSVRKFQFRLDCDSSARKIIQVVKAKLAIILKNERLIVCRSTPIVQAQPKRRLLRTLNSLSSLMEPTGRDLGRIVNDSKEVELPELILLAFNEQINLDSLRVAHDSAAHSASLAKLADHSQVSLSKFLPCMKPFIPRQRLLYLLVRGETINLFLYNYTNDVVAKAHEIVERCILWHNARSRLLREIGLQKMGITHLSTLRNSDARTNSYMLLTWMDPETLVNNDYPVDSLTTPDFSNLPRIYAQLLLKLYRFANPAFVAKGISPWPFEDQTQQMLALREDVRSMLNDHLRTDQGQEGPIAFTTQHH